MNGIIHFIISFVTTIIGCYIHGRCYKRLRRWNVRPILSFIASTLPGMFVISIIELIITQLSGSKNLYQTETLLIGILVAGQLKLLDLSDFVKPRTNKIDQITELAKSPQIDPSILEYTAKIGPFNKKKSTFEIAATRKHQELILQLIIDGMKGCTLEQMRQGLRDNRIPNEEAEPLVKETCLSISYFTTVLGDEPDDPDLTLKQKLVKSVLPKTIRHTIPSAYRFGKEAVKSKEKQVIRLQLLPVMTGIAILLCSVLALEIIQFTRYKMIIFKGPINHPLFIVFWGVLILGLILMGAGCILLKFSLKRVGFDVNVKDLESKMK